MLRIGEFAVLGGVSAKALRAYDERGIFHPAWVDPSTGYRYYSPAQLPELRRIIALKELGIPLADVALLVDGGSDLRDALARRRAELQEAQAGIQRRLAALDIRVEMADVGPDVVVRNIPAQRVALLSATVRPGEDIGPLFYELEVVVRDAGVRASLPPGAIAGQPKDDESVDVEVFVPVTSAVEADRVVSRRLAACRAATVIHRGPYGGMRAVRDTLDVWLVATGYEQAGPRRMVYLQFGAEPELDLPGAFLTQDATEFVTEIQIPVRVAP